MNASYLDGGVFDFVTDWHIFGRRTYLSALVFWNDRTLVSPCNNMIKMQSKFCLNEGSTEDIYAQEHCSRIAANEWELSLCSQFGGISWCFPFAEEPT